MEASVLDISSLQDDVLSFSSRLGFSFRLARLRTMTLRRTNALLVIIEGGPEGSLTGFDKSRRHVPDQLGEHSTETPTHHDGTS